MSQPFLIANRRKPRKEEGRKRRMRREKRRTVTHGRSPTATAAEEEEASLSLSILKEEDKAQDLLLRLCSSLFLPRFPPLLLYCSC